MVRVVLIAWLAAACGRIGFDALDDGGDVQAGFGQSCTNSCASGLACLGGLCSCFGELKSDEYNACTLGAEGTVYCWGNDDSGQLGRGTIGTPSATPSPVLGLPAVVDIDNGVASTCAVTASGALWCWGQIDVEGATGTPYQVNAPAGVVEVACGGFHCCARTSGREVWCWGHNVQGQIGIGATGNGVDVPTKVLTINDAISIGVGGFHTCAVRADHSLWCWGADDNGQVGDGQSNPSVPAPKQVPGLTGIEQVTGGDWFTCARDATGVWCWGINGVGQTGTGTSGSDVPTPTRVFGLGAVTDVSAGDDTACAIGIDRSLSCWGDDSLGALGDGAPGDISPSAVRVAGNVIDVALGRRHTCAIDGDGIVSCWGSGTAGELGDGMFLDRAVPAPSQLRCR